MFQTVHLRITTLDGSIKVSTLNIEEFDIFDNILILLSAISPKQISLPHSLRGQHLCLDREIISKLQGSSCSMPDQLKHISWVCSDWRRIRTWWCIVARFNCEENHDSEYKSTHGNSDDRLFLHLNI